MPTPHEAFLAIVTQYRETLKTLAIDVSNLISHEGARGAPDIMLATRHLEDAEMRLGRIQ